MGKSKDYDSGFFNGIFVSCQILSNLIESSNKTEDASKIKLLIAKAGETLADISDKTIKKTKGEG